MGDQNGVSLAMRPALRLLARPKPADRPDHPPMQGQTGTAQFVDPVTALVAPKGVTFIPTETALLLNVILPKMGALQRRAAVQFAIEDLIAQPLDLVHVVLGPRVRDDGTSAAWLVAVIGNSAMNDHIASQSADGGAMLLDVLAVQVPSEGEWAVLAGNDRVLVRQPDGSGFVSTPAALPILWAAGGSPKIMLLGGDLPAEVPVTSHVALAKTIDPQMMGFDLRSGRFGRRGSGWPKGARAIAVVLALAVTGHLSLLGLDIVGLRRIAATQDGALRQALEAVGQPSTGDIDTALTAALATQSRPAFSEFLPLLAQAFGAIDAQSGQLQIKDLRFAEAQNALTLTVEAPDLAALQSAETAFAAAGLQVSAGAATTGEGAAEAQMTLRRDAP